MACRCGGTFLTPILAIAALAAAGAGGYKLINGCGSCSDKSTPAALVSTTTDGPGSCSLCPGEMTACPAGVQTVSATEPLSCCTEGNAAKVSAVAAVSAKPDGCCMSKGEANVKTVAATEDKQACKEGTDGCSGDGKDGCCGGCDGQKKSEEKKADGTVATSGK